MAVSKNAIQVKWAAANSKSVAFGGTATSDEITLSANAYEADIILKADNDGTPAAGDEVKFFILYTTGDPDADPDVADEFDTTGHAAHLATLDTNTEDPAVRTIERLRTPTKVKLHVQNDSAGRNITVSAQILEYRA